MKNEFFYSVNDRFDAPRRIVAAAQIGFVLLSLVFLGFAQAEPIAVVTHEGVPVSALSREEVAELFLGQRSLSFSGISLIPVDVADESLREAFYQEIANMSAARVSAYWARRVFASQGRPPRKLPLGEAKSAVLSQAGTVTYLPNSGASGFKIVLRLP